MSKRHAFTLIELLVVIAIIGIVAALVVNMAAGAKVAQRAAQVNADKAKLTLMIDNYQSKLNFYPPDNGGLVSNANFFATYDGLAATNPLLYELTGATNNYPTTGNIFCFDHINAGAEYGDVFSRSSVQNGIQDGDVPAWDFFRPGPQFKEYTNYVVSATETNLEGLLVPVSMVGPTGVVLSANFWHYDASTTNRHNINSYDLWAEYVSSAKGGSNIIVTNGNW